MWRRSRSTSETNFLARRSLDQGALVRSHQNCRLGAFGSLLILISLAEILMPAFAAAAAAAADGVSIVTSSNTNAARKLFASRQFKAFNSEVYVIPDFLPEETAKAWRDKMQRLWNQTMEHSLEEDSSTEKTCTTDQGDDPPRDKGWVFATNNNGILTRDPMFENQKTRSLHNITERRHVAHQMRSNNQFSYAKWELADASLIAEIEETLTEPRLLESITELIHTDFPDAQLLHDSREMSDIFVAHYTKGDFLSAHDDGITGTWAVIIGLVEDDFDGAVDGGGLQFQCPAGALENSWCETLYPIFNTAVLFSTRVKNGPDVSFGPIHQVLDVTRPQGGRYSITGWWMDANDVWSELDLRERDMARSRSK